MKMEDQNAILYYLKALPKKRIKAPGYYITRPSEPTHF